MIKINELRQGNLVWTKACGMDAMITWDWNMLANFVNTWIKPGGSEVTVDPVPITDEWLQRLGVTIGEVIWKDRAWGLKVYKNLIRDGSGKYDGVVFSQVIGPTEHSVYPVCAKYVHELQNFYFAFTSKELTLKYKI